MALNFAIFPFLMSGAATAEIEICAGRPNPIAADMRILESQLSKDRVVLAKRFLKSHGTVDSGDDHDFGRRNALKTIRGYELKMKAVNGEKMDVENFCRWLSTEGFWYD